MTSITSRSPWYGKRRKRPAPKADPPISEAKLTQLMAEKEANIEKEISAELAEMRDVIYIVGQPAPPRPKIDRTLEKELYGRLTMSERVEFAFRCRAKARDYWENGDQERKWKWGGY
jgi:hypothetical protein